MYEVLMPVDESESRALTQANAAADLPCASEGVRVSLLRIFDDLETSSNTALEETDSGAAALDVLSDAGITTNEMRRAGDPATEILQAADQINADLILLGGRKRSPLGSLLFGSVSQEVTLDASRPVVVTGEGQREQPSHVCQSCGEEYYTSADAEIATCRNCGGTKVEAAA